MRQPQPIKPRAADMVKLGSSTKTHSMKETSRENNILKVNFTYPWESNNAPYEGLVVRYATMSTGLELLNQTNTIAFHRQVQSTSPMVKQRN